MSRSCTQVLKHYAVTLNFKVYIRTKMTHQDNAKLQIISNAKLFYKMVLLKISKECILYFIGLLHNYIIIVTISFTTE
jgi:hypothetical protein